jgi:hypothetical protein
MNDEKRFVESGRDFRRVEGFVEHMAVEAPVAAEDDEDAFVSSGSGVDGFGDFFGGIGGR